MWSASSLFCQVSVFILNVHLRTEPLYAYTVRSHITYLLYTRQFCEGNVLYTELLENMEGPLWMGECLSVCDKPACFRTEFNTAVMSYNPNLSISECPIATNASVKENSTLRHLNIVFKKQLFRNSFVVRWLFKLFLPEQTG